MPPKRKRPERGSAEGGRPSPHRPGDTALGQHDRDGGPGRPGGRNSRPTRRNERRDSLQSPTARATPANASFTTPSSQPVSHSQTTRPSAPPTQSQPHQISTAQAAESSMPRPNPVSSNYPYDLLDGDKLRVWTGSGRQHIIQHGAQSLQDQDIQELTCLFQEFLHSVIEGRMDPIEAGTCVKEILGPESSEMIKNSYAFEPHALFLDTISTIIEGEQPAAMPAIRRFLEATEVSTQLEREMLEVPSLIQLGLIRDSFTKLAIRHATNLLYRQANYNLLREETEGYSKLTTELFTISGSGPPTAELVQATFEKIKALIGTFDLDVGRVLDVTLDVFAAVIIKQFRFFIKLLRASSWWPRHERPSTIFAGGLPNWALPDSDTYLTTEEEQAAIEEQKRDRDLLFWDRAREVQLDAFFELGGRQVTDGERRLIIESPDNAQPETGFERSWIEMTKTLPPQGNKTAAQLLGFKLRFYANDARAEDDVLPANLLYLAALLIKVGFISLCDLYPHLWPADENMEELKAKKLKDLEEKERKERGGEANPLAKAGALSDETAPPPASTSRGRDAATAAKAGSNTPLPNATADAKEKPKLPDPLEQKISLLVCLLTIGALPEALFMLGKNPWIVEAEPEVLDRIHRILKHSLSKVFADCNAKMASLSECPTKDMATVDQTGVLKGSVKVARLQPKRVLRWPYPDKADTNENQNYRFYWDEWADNIPVCQTVDDVFTLCSTFLNVSGVNIGKDVSLVAGLCTIGAQSLDEDPSQANRDRWQDLSRRLLVPALSLTTNHSSVAGLVWNLLKRYPLVARFKTYADWYEGQISRLPPIRTAFTKTRRDTMGIMKRVSRKNVREMANSLAKLTYSSPGIAFKVALDQMESYPNMIEVFVSCAKYFTPLAYDVLLWSLLNSLGGQHRSRTQESSILLTGKWLQALSRFSGKVFKNYPVLNLSPIILYVNDQLLSGNSTDLIILTELLSSMGGVVPAVDFTDDQIMALAGWETLRKQTLINIGDLRFDSDFARSSKRLLKALIDANLVGQLLINIAQFRQSAMFKVDESRAHIKVLSSMVDDSQQTLAQFLDFLRSNLDPAAFDAQVPSIDQLMTKYGLDISFAFLVGRASLSQKLVPKDDQPRSQAPQPPQPSQVTQEEGAGDVAMADAPLPTQEPKEGESDKPSPAKSDTNGPSAGNHTEISSSSSQVTSRINDPFPEVLRPIIDSIEQKEDASFWKTITPEFYIMFWALQLGDIHVPEDQYQKEGERAFKAAKELAAQRNKSLEAEYNAKREIPLAMTEEKTKHKKAYSRNKLHMIRNFKSWFPDTTVKLGTTADVILERCLLPRLALSASDTEYCYRMIRFLHDYGAPNFKLMTLYDRLFNANRLRCTIFTLTVREAEHFGRFLKRVLGDLSRWHKDKAVYEREALVGPQQKERTLLGFATEVDEEGKPKAFVEHAQFKDLLYGWHRSLNAAVKACLGGMEWMQIRNAITVLKSILDFFPAVDFMAQHFMKQLKTITDREAASKAGSGDAEEGHRVDLSVSAQTAMSELQRRKSKWVMVQGFRPNRAGEPAAQGRRGESPRPSNLRPTAAEFKPGHQATPRPSNRAQFIGDDEDGEIKDGEENKSQSQSKATTTTRSQKDNLPAKPTAVAPPPARSSNGDRPPSRPSRDAAAAQGPRQSSSTTTPTSNTSRADSASKPPSLPERPPVGLPNRPNVPLPAYLPPDHLHSPRPDTRDARTSRDSRETRDHRHTRDSRDPRDTRDVRDHRDSRDSRDARSQDPSRLERPTDLPPPGRRGQDHGNAREGRDLRESRDVRDARDARDSRDTRDSRDAPRADASRRESAHDGRDPRSSTRDRAPPPPQLVGRSSSRPRDAPPSASASSSSATQPNRQEPSVNPARAAQITQNDRAERPSDSDRRDRGGRQTEAERQDFVNPARAALIDHGRGSGRDDLRDKPSSRPHSPRRSDRPSEVPPQDAGRDDRHRRSHASDHRASGKDSRTETAAPPPPSSSARTDRRAERDGERPTENTARHSTNPRAPEPEPARQGPQDPNYGRLSQIPAVPDIPSGPRGRGRGIPRAPTGPASTAPAVASSVPTRPDGRFPLEPPRAATPDRQPPTGPSSGRARRGPFESTVAPSGTTAPAAGNPSASTPQTDRGRPTPSGPSPATSFHGTPTAPAGVHPDRIQQIAPPPPPPPPGPPPHRHQGPASRQPSGRFAPQVDTGRSNRQLAGITKTLQQAQANSISDASRNVRGRGQRANLANSDAQILTGASPVSTPTNEFPDQTRAPEPVNDRTAANGDRGDEPRRDKEREHRTGRSRRGSRERGSDRDREKDKADRGRDGHRDRPDREREREKDRERERSPERDREKDARSYRDRRSAASTTANTGNTPREDRERDRDRDRDRERDRESRRSGHEAPREASSASHGSGRDRAAGNGRAHDNTGRELIGARDVRHRDAAPPPRPDEWSSGRGGGHRGAPRDSTGARDSGARDSGVRDPGAGRHVDDRREREEPRGRKRRSEEGADPLERGKRQRR